MQNNLKGGGTATARIYSTIRIDSVYAIYELFLWGACAFMNEFTAEKTNETNFKFSVLPHSRAENMLVKVLRKGYILHDTNQLHGTEWGFWLCDVRHMKPQWQRDKLLRSKVDRTQTEIHKKIKTKLPLI